MATQVTAALEISKIEDLRGIISQEDRTLEQFCGDWVSHNEKTRGLARIIVRPQGTGLIVHAFGAGEGELNDWGTAPAEVFAEGASAVQIRGFLAFYDFGFMETFLQAKTEKGVLVIASFNRFKDQSGRRNYFSREFLYRVAV